MIWALGASVAVTVALVPRACRAVARRHDKELQSARTMVGQGGIQPVISHSTFKGCGDRVEPLGRLYVPPH
jgi:hypothetical protein